MFLKEISRGPRGTSDLILPPDEVKIDLDPEGLESLEIYDEQAPQPPEPAGGSYSGEFED